MDTYQLIVMILSSSLQLSTTMLIVSRLPLPESGSEPEAEVAQIITMKKLETLPDDVRRATSVDPVLIRVIMFLHSGWPAITLDESLKPFKQRYKELSIDGGYLMWGLFVVIPLSLQSRVLQELHESHPGISRMKSLARMNVW